MQESHGQSTSTSATQAFTKLDNLVDRFAKDHSITRESARQFISSAAAESTVGIGWNRTSSTFKVGATGQHTSSKQTKDLVSSAEDFTKQRSFQNALSSAKQASHDLRESTLNDVGKRFVSGFNASSEKSESLRREASQNLQKSESYSHMASWTKQNAGSLNANLNQEYVGWLQKQALPNSKGPMGIREAETILSARPNLDTAYQRRFMEEKMGSFKAGSLPVSPETLSSRFKTSSPFVLAGNAQSSLRQKAGQEGFSEYPHLKSSIVSDVEQGMDRQTGKIVDQSRAVQDEKRSRYWNFGWKTKK